MPFAEPHDGERVELAILQVDIAGHSKLVGTDRALQGAKEILQKQVEGIAEIRDGRRMGWAGDGGAFMFRTADGAGVDGLAFTALQILQTLPAINEEILVRTQLAEALSLRISCDVDVVNYHTDGGLVTADFINRFMKYERLLGLVNSVSVTHRIWKQLSPALKDKFQPFKMVKEVESLIYNHGGKDRQSGTLRSLANLVRKDGRQEPNTKPESVEIVAFKGDTLLELSRAAYQDVLIEGYENIGGLNLLVTKNAERCRQHVEGEKDDDDQIPEQIRNRLADLPQETAWQLRRMWPDLPRRIREELTENVANMSPCELRDMLAGVEAEAFRHSQSTRVPEPDHEFSGGESLRFFNCAALGFLPLIGASTELDLVLGSKLQIAEVIGGVEHTVAPVRIFENHEGRLVEISEKSTQDAPDADESGRNDRGDGPPKQPPRRPRPRQ